MIGWCPNKAGLWPLSSFTLLDLPKIELQVQSLKCEACTANNNSINLPVASSCSWEYRTAASFGSIFL